MNIQHAIAMQNALCGMHWAEDIILPPMRKTASLEDGLFLLRKYAPDIVWNMLATLENNPCTQPQVACILQGLSVGKVRLHDVDQVRHLDTAWIALHDMLKEGTFALNKACACVLHAHTGKEEALRWGEFRTGNVSLQHVRYAPPDHSMLDAEFAKGMAYLQQCSPAPLRALAVFLYMSRMQFFYDANKRTALLMCYGELLQHGTAVFILPKAKQEEFLTILGAFYETGRADDALRFLAEQGRENGLS